MDSLTSMDILGLIAGSLTTIAFVPQLLKVWKSKSAQDISYVMFIMFIAGIILWEIYGWGIHSMPVILFNVITFVLGLAILVLKFIFDRKANESTEASS
ncbi:MAG: SemiSWEET transporter [Prochlorococcus sp.]